MLSDDRRQEYIKEFDELNARYGLTVEDSLDELAAQMLRLAEGYEPLIASCLQSCAEHLQHASMDFYVSLK
jgi:hypothetical protein